MDRAKQREIASKGGKAAHQKGTAHEWTSEEARDAGRKGGIASHQRRREQSGGQSSTDGSDTEAMTGSSDDRTIAMDRSASRSSVGSSSSGSSMDRGESYGSERGASSESPSGWKSEE
jgi:general stress protein YciG